MKRLLQISLDVLSYKLPLPRTVKGIIPYLNNISNNTKMMLDLQTIVEELSKCEGKAWVIVTSQQQINDLIKDDNINDFHKIRSRFKTRINLSSSNVDEIIKATPSATGPAARTPTIPNKLPKIAIAGIKSPICLDKDNIALIPLLPIA